MNWDESRGVGGRRSKLEMVGDVLRVISQGVEKPTRIMQLANLTWRDLLMYLEVLSRNQLVIRDAQGGRTAYKLTEKGNSMLELYVKLKQESASLGLDSLSAERVSDALKVKTPALRDDSATSALMEKLRASGFSVIKNKVVGKSGETHAFDIVASAKDGSTHGYLMRNQIKEEDVLSLFVNQLDTDLHIHAYSRKQVPDGVKRLAESYSIDVRSLDQG